MDENQTPEQFVNSLTPEQRAIFYDTSKVHNVDDLIAEEDRPRFMQWRRTQRAIEVLAYPVVFIRGLYRYLKSKRRKG